MSTPTVWPARRVGDRILCGRQVDGRYVCQGELAWVGWFVPFPGQPGVQVIMLDRGLVREAGTDRWRLQSRAVRQLAQGRRPTDRHRAAAPVPLNVQGDPAAFDWRRACPHCGTLAIVTPKLLDSVSTE